MQLVLATITKKARKTFENIRFIVNAEYFYFFTHFYSRSQQVPSESRDHS